MSAKNIFLIILVGVVVAAIVFFTIQENQKPKEKIDLQLRLKAGESHEMKLTKNHETTQIYKDRMMKVKSKEEDIIGFDVKSVDPNGRMNVVFFYKSVALDFNSPQGDMKYTSSKPPVESNDMYLNAISEITSAVLASRFSINVAPTGGMSEIQGFSNIEKNIEAKIRKRAAEQLNDPNLSAKDKAALAELQKKFLEPSIKETIEYYNGLINSVKSDTKEMLECIFMKFPYRPVAADNRWYDKTQLNITLPVDANITYIFKKKENGLAYVDVVADVEMKNLKVTDITSRYKESKCVSGVRSATNTVNPETGLLQKSEAKLKFAGRQYIETDKTALSNVSLKGVRPNMDIQIKIEGTNIIELIK